MLQFNSFNDEQFLNIKLISVTLQVLKLERFNSFNDEQLLNIKLILVTLLVLKVNIFIL